MCSLCIAGDHLREVCPKMYGTSPVACGAEFPGNSYTQSHDTGGKVCYPRYRPQRSCGQGNVFRAVRDSVHSGGVCQGDPPKKEPPPNYIHSFTITEIKQMEIFLLLNV